MIVELGHLLLIVALPLALLTVFAPIAARQMRDTRWHSLIGPSVWLQFLCLAGAFSALAYAFLTDDFSVDLVAQHSNTKLPDHFKFSALWGNHEGSLLLWCLILAAWTLAVLIYGRSLPNHIRYSVLAVLAFISVGFLVFIIFTSNPFLRNLISAPSDGADLNPLLQDPGLIFHPPLLYTGYVGFSVSFAFAIAALISGQLDAAWARWSRPWTNTAWAFLTIGIALGSWWAYYELGWGGWWFWDPVENASFMPWLAGTALIHSLAATEKRGVFRSWTVLLAIMAFSLSLLGTFLVRSGILVSVHAFAADPTRGLFILAFLVLVIGGSLLLYGLRVPALKGGSRFSFLSRESALLMNNILLAVALVVVLIGTLFPLVMNALELGSFSVGAPYFNAFAAPVGIPMVLLMGFAPFLFWNTTSKKQLIGGSVAAILLLSFLLSMALIFYVSSYVSQSFSVFISVCVMACFFLIGMTLRNLKLKMQSARPAGSAASSLRDWVAQLPGRSYMGMVVAHIGIGVTVIGISVTSRYTLIEEVGMRVGSAYTLGAYTYSLQSFNDYQGPNYLATRATIEVQRDGQSVAMVYPEKRKYLASQSIMTEAGIAPTLLRDIYVSLGELIEPGLWSVSLQLKPAVRLIWLGAILMSLGAVLAVTDKRYRVAKKVSGDTATLSGQNDTGLTAEVSR